MTISIGSYFSEKYPSLALNHPDWIDRLVWLHSSIQPNYYNDGRPYDRSTTGMFLEWRSQDKTTWIYKIYGMPAQLKVLFSNEKDRLFYILKWS